MRRIFATPFALGGAGAIALSYHLLCQAHAAGSAKSATGDPSLALHLENLGALAFACSLMAGFSVVMVVVRGAPGARAAIAMGATVLIGVPLWVAMVWLTS